MSSSHTGKVIKCRAAIAWAPNTPLTVEEIHVEPPRAGEVRFRLVASGICHSDLYMLEGNPFGELQFPIVLGHEGAGVVESVGERVTRFQPGDRVIPLYMPQCGECKFCVRPETNLCDRNEATQVRGVMPDETTRFSCRGQVVYHFMGCSTFSEYSVVPEAGLCRIDPAAPLDKVCLLGCGVPTGMGAAINTGRVQPGATVAIWGLGGVGLAAVMGARLAGASRIIAVDVNPLKFEIGKKFGCTEFVNPKEHNRPVEEVLAEMTGGGVDVAIECCGLAETTKAAFESVHRGWGVGVSIGLVKGGKEVSFNPLWLLLGKTWKGSSFGGYKPLQGIPQLIELYNQGKILLDEFVTGQISLNAAEINGAFDGMRTGDGKVIRTIIKYE